MMKRKDRNSRNKKIIRKVSFFFTLLAKCPARCFVWGKTTLCWWIDSCSVLPTWVTLPSFCYGHYHYYYHLLTSHPESPWLPTSLCHSYGAALWPIRCWRCWWKIVASRGPWRQLSYDGGRYDLWLISSSFRFGLLQYPYCRRHSNKKLFDDVGGCLNFYRVEYWIMSW